MCRAAALLLLWSLCGAAGARPANWYKWSSMVNGTVICAQSSPGESWERGGQAYRDGHCSVPRLPAGGVASRR